MTTERKARLSPRGIWQDLYNHPTDGPLPAFLLVLTMVAGVVDAISMLRLGQIFVSNMTGNVVVLGFAIAGAPGFSLSASVCALSGFIVGAAAWGTIARRWHADRRTILKYGLLAELTLLGMAMVVTAFIGDSPGNHGRNIMAAVLATAMGLQNAVVLRLAIPELTTTVVTRTLAGIAADIASGHWHIVPRSAMVFMLLFGAICGAVLVLYVSLVTALLLAFLLVFFVTVTGLFATRNPASWN